MEIAGSSAYVAAETFRFRSGLGEKLRRAVNFYAVITGGILVGMIMDLLRIDPINPLFWSAVLNGIAAVPLIGVIAWIAADAKLMGKWRSSLLARAWGWATFVLMGAATAGMFYFIARGS
jgi:Mn2+/Fe2+ NRAMP family transporter